MTRPTPEADPNLARRIRMRLLVLRLLGGSLAVASLALAGVPEPLSLSTVLQEAKEHNPELQAARERSKAMAAVPAQVSAYDDPTLSWEAWNAPESFRVDEADNNIFRLSQKFPFPGKRRLAGNVATHEADQARHEASTVELEVIAAVKRGYYGLWQAHQRRAVYAREEDLVERFAHIVEQKYASGGALQSDVLRAQVELTHLVNRGQTEELSIAHAEAELRALLSRDAGQPLGIPEDPAPPALDSPPAQLVTVALSERPDVAAQAAAIARGEAAVALAHRNYYPDFEVSVARFQNHAERDGFGAMASVTLPIFNGAKYGAGVNEANARLEVARSERRRLQDRVRREVEQAYLAARTSLLQYNLFVKTHIPQAEQALRVTESAYQTGAVAFLDLVDTLRSIESVHIEHIMAQAEFEKAYADLERVVGVELPRSIAKGPSAGRAVHDG